MDTEERCFGIDERVYVRSGRDTRWVAGRIIEQVSTDRYAVKITEPTVFSTENIAIRETRMTKEIRRNFVPRSDITAYELAIIYRNITNSSRNSIIFEKKIWESLPETITRHFVEHITS